MGCYTHSNFRDQYQHKEIDPMSFKSVKNMRTSSRTIPSLRNVCLSLSVDITFGQPVVMKEQDWVKELTGECAENEDETSQFRIIWKRWIGVSNGFSGNYEWWTICGLLKQTRSNLDPNEDVTFIFDGAPALSNPSVSFANTKLKSHNYTAHS